MHIDTVFSELSLVIVVTAIISILMRLIKQPLILGYILAGLLVGPAGLSLIHSTDLFQVFSGIGIALLLFIIGLGMNVNEVKRLGNVVFFTAFTTFLAISSAGFLTASALGFSKTEAFITGLALFFSSTIIIVKILSDKKEQNRLHGQIAIGVILFDDLVATLALLFVVAGKDGGGFHFADLVILTAKSVFLLIALVLASTKLIPRITKYMASNQELLFLFAIGWGFGVATIFEKAGFSIEVGALFAGVALASSTYVQEIASRLKPLRDFFVVIFFITLGESMNLGNITSGIIPALILSALVIIIKPITVITVTGLMGYTKRIAFKTGINLSQISEFSIILVLLAASVGMVGPDLSAVITLVAIITIAISTYLMQYDDVLFNYFDKIKLRLFEKEASFQDKRSNKSYKLVLLGYDQGGYEIIKTFKELGKKFLVIDYDPEVIEVLEKRKVDYLYGDAADLELLKEAQLDKSELIVSSIIGHDVNKFVVSAMGKLNPDAVVIAHADTVQEATELYDLGASYVMMPHYIGNEKVGSFIKRSNLKKSEFNKYRDKHRTYLQSHLADEIS